MEFVNLKTVMSNTRSRVVLIFTFAVLVIAVIVGVGLLSRNLSTDHVQVNRVPPIKSVVGGFDRPVSPEYAKLLKEQNKQEAEAAFQTRGSAVPTIINAQSFPGAPPSVCNCQAGSCTTPAGTSGVAALQTTASPPMGTICSDGTVRDTNGKIIGRTGIVAPGGLVFDKQGKVLGTISSDGTVHNAAGAIVGTLAADGTVRDANGNVIGSTGAYGANTPSDGNLVFDQAGRVIGSVGADGKVKDAQGKVVGTVSSDGTVHDMSGKVIGKALSGSQVGQVAYDANGKAIGTVGKDGIVRDTQGNVVGTLASDGSVHDATGKTIGKVQLSAQPPHFAYDQTGRVIGMVGADGKVRDAAGKVVGTVGTDGVVHDNLGNVIGNTTAATPGATVYDSQGHLVGIVGADGKVRDANGNVVGKVGSDGVVRNAAGTPIGKTSYIAPGSAVFGADGHLLGSVGADGRLVPATVGPSSTGVGADDFTSGGAGSQRDQALERQQQMLQQQKASQMVAQLQNAMAGQMAALQTAWLPPTQSVVRGTDDGDKTAGGGAGSAGATGASGNIIYKAGSIIFATIDTAVNTDEPGPVLATISNGKLKGGKLIGSIQSQGQKVLLSFSTLNMPSASTSVGVNTVAIDPATARTALSSDTDNHYLLRYGTLFASSFLSGYAQAISQSGSETTITLQGITHSIPQLNAQQKLLVALGQVGQQYSGVVGSLFNTPPTVKVYAGTGVGILFLSDFSAPPDFPVEN